MNLTSSKRPLHLPNPSQLHHRLSQTMDSKYCIIALCHYCRRFIKFRPRRHHICSTVGVMWVSTSWTVLIWTCSKTLFLSLSDVSRIECDKQGSTVRSRSWRKLFCNADCIFDCVALIEFYTSNLSPCWLIIVGAS